MYLGSVLTERTSWVSTGSVRDEGQFLISCEVRISANRCVSQWSVFSTDPCLRKAPAATYLAGPGAHQLHSSGQPYLELSPSPDELI